MLKLLIIIENLWHLSSGHFLAHLLVLNEGSFEGIYSRKLLLDKVKSLEKQFQRYYPQSIGEKAKKTDEFCTCYLHFSAI